MAHPALAMAVRSLRIDARAPLQYGLRGAVVAVLIVAVALAVSISAVLGAPGLHLCRVLVLLNLVLLTLMGVAGFSSVITEEREASTLGLLRLAGFGPASILLGKSIGHLVTTALLLALQLPFAVLAATLGGVSPRQIADGYAVLGAYTVLLFGLGALSSSLCERGVAAARMTAIGAGLWVLAAPVAATLASQLAGVAWFAGAAGASLRRLLDTLAELSPLSALDRILAAAGAPADVSATLWTSVLLGALLWYAACWVFGREGRAREPAPRAAERDASRPRSRPAPDASALVWRDFHFIAGGPFGHRVRAWCYGSGALLIGVWSWSSGATGRELLAAWASLVMAAAAIAGLVEVGIHAGRVFRLEIQDRTLFGPALLPMRVGTWGFAKVCGCLRVVAVPIAYFTVATAVLVIADPQVRSMIFPITLFGLLYAGAAAAVLVHATLWLSLLVPKGAFAAAVAASATAVALVVTAGKWWWGIFLPGLAPLVCIWLQVAIARRLEQCAAR